MSVLGSLPPPTPLEQSWRALEGGRVQGCWWDHGGISFPPPAWNSPQEALPFSGIFWLKGQQKDLLPGRKQGMEMPLHSRRCSWLWCQAGQSAVAGRVTGTLSPFPSSFVKLPMVFSQSHCSRKGDASPDSV